MRTLSKIVGPLLLLLLATGCNLTSQATARTVAVSTLLTTPSIPITGEAIAGHVRARDR